MKNNSLAPSNVNFSALNLQAVPQSAMITLSILCLLFVTLVVSVLVPPVGTLLIQCEFPLLGVWLLTQRGKDKFDPAITFSAAFLLWCWFGSIDILPSFYQPFNDGQWRIYLFSFIAFWCGSFMAGNQNANTGRLRGLRVIWREDAFFLIMLALGLAAVLTWASITAAEGVPIFRPDVETLRVELPSRHHIAFQIMIASSDITLPLTFLYLWTVSKPRFKKTLYLFSLFSFFVFISTGDRGMILPSLLTIFAMRHYLKKPWKLAYTSITAIVLGILVSASGYYRSLQHWGPGYAIGLARKGIPVAVQPFMPIYFSIRSPLETFREVLRLIPATTPYQLGHLTFGFIEQLLPGRHLSSDFFFKELLGLSFVGFGDPASLLGTFYGDFGVVGIVVGMFLTGLLSRMIYFRMFRHSLGWVIVYCFVWQKLISSIYGSLFTYVIEVLIPLTWLIVVTALTGPVAYNENI